MNPSPFLLKKMGLKFARSILPSPDLISEERLWRSVVVNAIEDCLIEHNDRKSSLLKIYSHNWILLRSKDFNVVCGWGRLDPDDIEECYIAAVKNKAITFSKRQILWFDYDKLYQKMLKADVVEKKEMRRQINSMRDVVKQAPIDLLSTVFVSAFV